MQEKIFEIEKGATAIKYDVAKDVAVTMALRRAEQRRPKEDEVHAVERSLDGGGEYWDRDSFEEVECGYCYDEANVDAVGMGKGSAVMGPDVEDDKETVILGRTVRWKDWGIEFEADEKHRKILAELF